MEGLKTVLLSLIFRIRVLPFYPRLRLQQYIDHDDEDVYDGDGNDDDGDGMMLVMMTVMAMMVMG